MPAWASVGSLFTVFALGFAVAFVLTSAFGPSSSELRINELQRAEAERDAEQITLLSEKARDTRDSLVPVLTAMAEAVPLDGTQSGNVPSANTVIEWRNVVSAELRRFANSDSAGNGVNVSRTAMKTALEQFDAAVDLFETAVAAPGPLQETLIAQAGNLRTLALRTWSVGAVQLDVINIDAGHGHVHVYLPSGSDAGGLAPDGAPEGTGQK